MYKGDDIRKRREDIQNNILKSFGCDIEKARSGIYMNTPENRRLGRVGQPYGKTKGIIIDFNPLKLELKKYKDTLSAQSIFSGVNNKQMLEDIDKVLEFVTNNKIKINGRFKIEKGTTKTGRVSQKICWQSVRSVGREASAFAGKRRNWAENKLQESIIRQVAEKQGLFISEKETMRWGKPFDTKGSEAYVYDDPDDDTKVLKSVYHFVQNPSFLSFVERTIGFNTLFPDTAYDVIGFRQETEDEDRLGLHLVLRQPAVHGYILARLPSENEHQKALQQFEKLGYDVDFNNKTISKNGYVASDLSEYNIMKAPDGRYHIIDAWVRKIS